MWLQAGAGKWLRLYQTIRNLTPGNMQIPLVVIQSRVTGLKKIKILYLLDLFEGSGEKRQCDIKCVECLWMIVLIVVMLMSYSPVVSVVLVLSRVGLHTLNFLHSSLSVIQQEIFKKIVLIAHTWDERNFYYLHFETKET